MLAKASSVDYIMKI